MDTFENQIRNAREAILAVLTSSESNVNEQQRNVVRALMADISAIREVKGVPFDELARILQPFEWQGTGEILRDFFYEEKYRRWEISMQQMEARYQKRMEGVMQQFLASAQANIEAIIQKAVDRAAMAGKTDGENGSGAGTNGGGNDKREAARPSSRAGVLEEEKVGAPPVKSEVSAGSRGAKPGGDFVPPNQQELEALLNMHVDLSAIPKRPLGE